MSQPAQPVPARLGPNPRAIPHGKNLGLAAVMNDAEFDADNLIDSGPAVDINNFVNRFYEQGKIPNRVDCAKILVQGIRISENINAARQNRSMTYRLAFTNNANPSVKTGVEIVLDMDGYLRVHPEMQQNKVLTRAKFYAVLHIVNYLEGYGIHSALTRRASWAAIPEIYATPMVALAGSGFQFIGKWLRDHQGADAGMMAVYWITCYLLDYLSLTGKINKNVRDKRRVGTIPFIEYVASPEYYNNLIPDFQTGTVDGAVRNLGITGTATFGLAQEAIMKDYITKLVVSESSSLQQRKSGNDGIMKNVAREALEEMRRENERRRRQMDEDDDDAGASMVFGSESSGGEDPDDGGNDGNAGTSGIQIETMEEDPTEPEVTRQSRPRDTPTRTGDKGKRKRVNVPSTIEQALSEFFRAKPKAPPKEAMIYMRDLLGSSYN